MAARGNPAAQTMPPMGGMVGWLHQRAGDSDPYVPLYLTPILAEVVLLIGGIGIDDLWAKV
jgi:hypothetical protein